MDVFFDMEGGTFVIDPDQEDLAKTNRQRYVVIKNAIGDAWPHLPGSPIKPGAEFDGFRYTHLVSVDDVEHHVTSTMPREATNELLRVVADELIKRIKRGDEGEVGPPDEEVEGDEDLDGGESGDVETDPGGDVESDA